MPLLSSALTLAVLRLQRELRLQDKTLGDIFTTIRRRDIRRE